MPIIATGLFDVVLTAFNYSMLWREAAIELIPEAKRQNMGILLGSPTQQGWLSRRYDAQLEAADSRWLNKPRRDQLKLLYRLVDDLGIPLPELSLRWALMNADAASVLTGPKNDRPTAAKHTNLRERPSFPGNCIANRRDSRPRPF